MSPKVRKTLVPENPPRAGSQRKQSSSGLNIVFSKLVTMTGNRGCLLRMVFEKCNPLIYCAATITI